jgi:HD-like signal output (HDOD) protein/CheY-like chemotaxis protein
MSHARTIAVLVADPARAAQLGDALGREGFETVLAQSSDELYGLVVQRRIAAVVIDNALRGFLRGIEIVERLAADLVRPAIVLLGDLTADERRQAERLKIDQLVAARDDTPAILQALQTSLLRASHAGVVIPPAARSLVRQYDVIQPLPQLLVKLSGYLDDPESSVADLARDIATDPRITGDLLKLTNSAALGLRTRVTRVLDAVNLLGIKQTVSLVLSSSLTQAQRQMLKPLPKSFQATFRVRSVLIGSTAATFARRSSGASADTAYILGLLQELGMLVLAQAYGERYVQLVEHARSIGSLRLEHCEENDYGLTHADVSAALLQKWELPASLITLVLDHHDEIERPHRSELDRNLLRAMQIGEALADLREASLPQRHRTLNRLLEPYGGAPSELCKSALAEAVARTQESCRLFDIPAPNESEVERLRQRLLADVAPEEDDQPSAAAAGGTGAQAEQRGPKATVLVIDDDPAIVNAIRGHLHPLGVDVQGTSSAAEAQLLIPHAAAVLCDLHLRGKTGFEVVRELKRQGLSAPVLALSGDRSRATVTESISVGMVDFILKPFNRATLVEKLHRHAGLNLGSVAPPELPAARPAPAGSMSV